MLAGEKIYRLVLYIDTYRERRRKLSLFFEGSRFFSRKKKKKKP